MRGIAVPHSLEKPADLPCISPQTPKKFRGFWLVHLMRWLMQVMGDALPRVIAGWVAQRQSPSPDGLRPIGPVSSAGDCSASLFGPWASFRPAC
jgi:hypothetical protein